MDNLKMAKNENKVLELEIDLAKLAQIWRIVSNDIEKLIERTCDSTTQDHKQFELFLVEND